MVVEGRPGNLVVSIPRNVRCVQARQRVAILFDVSFSRREASLNERELGSVSGQCWLDALKRCARIVTRGAADAADRIRVIQVPEADAVRH